MEKPRPSTIAWGVLAAGVVAYDALCPKGEMLSERVDDWLETHPKTTYTFIGAVALHLANMLPEKVDPIHQLSRLIEKD